MQYKRHKKKLCFFILFTLTIFSLIFLWQMQFNLQSELHLLEGELHYVNIYYPFKLYVHNESNREDILKLNGIPVCKEGIALNSSKLTLEALNKGQVNLEFRFFGIPFRQVTVNVIPEIRVIPGGHSIGIKLHSEGVIVSGYYYTEQNGQSYSPAEEAGIKVGETIVGVEGEKIKDINEVIEMVNYWSKKKDSINLTLLNEGEEYNRKITPIYIPNEGYFLGLYIRDTAAGVGTLSFYEPNTKKFGALGHIITDLDSNKPAKIYNGEIVKANIIDVKMAHRGQPGEKKGIFMDHEDVIGKIYKNTDFGIFGSINELDLSRTPYSKPIPIGLSSQVETGPAKILTVVDGHTVESFDVYIERAYMQTSPQDRSLIIKVKDDRLIEMTGGIVQGMSGSPIIQKGRLIGAVTHVFVNDPLRGYGIFIEWMINEAGIYDERVIENIIEKKEDKNAA